MKSGIKLRGQFHAVCYRPDGTIRWEELFGNLLTNEGLDHLLDGLLGGATQVSPWYVLLKNTGTPAATDTLSSHGTWTENTNYTGNRQEYIEAASSGQSVTNSASKASFAIDTDSQALYGAGLASAATGTTGTLLCVADFSSVKNADNGDTLEVTYTLSAADDGA